jgi:hypothetical protein
MHPGSFATSPGVPTGFDANYDLGGPTAVNAGQFEGRELGIGTSALSATQAAMAKVYGPEMGAQARFLRMTDPYASKLESLRINPEFWQPMACDGLRTAIIAAVSATNMTIIRKVLPVRASNTTTYIQRTRVFPEHLMEQTPELAPPHGISDRWEEVTHFLDRYAAKFDVETTSLLTPGGVDHMRNKIIQVSHMVSRTMVVIAMRAIIAAANPTYPRAMSEPRYGVPKTYETYPDSLRQACEAWGLISGDGPSGPARLAKMVMDALTMQGADTDGAAPMLILPWGATAAMVFPFERRKIESDVGYGGPDPMLGQLGRFEALEMTPIKTSPGDPGSCPLTNNRVVGKYYIADSEHIPISGYLERKYSTENRSIQIHSHAGDVPAKIDLRTMFKQSGLFDKRGILTDLGRGVFVNTSGRPYGTADDFWTDNAPSSLDTQELGRPDSRILIDNGTNEFHAWLVGNLDTNRYFPICFYLFANAQQWQTGDVVGIIPGSQTGNTFTMMQDVMVGGNVALKTLTAHTTAYMAGVILNRKNVVIIPNAAVMRPLSGCGTSFWDPNDQTDRDTYRNGISGSSYVKDLFSVAVLPRKETRIAKPNFMDITGKFSPDRSDQLKSSTKDDFLYQSAPAYAQFWQWTQGVGPEGPMPYGAQMDYLLPTFCSRGHAAVFYGEHTFQIVGSGHWPHASYQGFTADHTGKGNLIAERPNPFAAVQVLSTS